MVKGEKSPTFEHLEALDILNRKAWQESWQWARVKEERTALIKKWYNVVPDTKERAIQRDRLRGVFTPFNFTREDLLFKNAPLNILETYVKVYGTNKLNALLSLIE